MSLGCLLLGLGLLLLCGRRAARPEGRRGEADRLAFERRWDALKREHQRRQWEAERRARGPGSDSSQPPA